MIEFSPGPGYTAQSNRDIARVLNALAQAPNATLDSANDQARVGAAAYLAALRAVAAACNVEARVK